MKPTAKIILSVSIMSVLFWVAEGFADYYCIHSSKGNLWGSLIFVSPVELLTRITIVAAFIVFGIVMAIASRQRRQAEDTLRENEERLRLAIFGADLGTWDWSIPTGRVEYNQRYSNMLGYECDEIEPSLQFWESLLHPDDVPCVMERLNACLDGKTDFYETEHRLKHKSGEWLWVLAKGSITERDSKGNPLRASGTHLDITERKKVEEALRCSEEKFSKAFVLSPDSININRLSDGCYIDINRGFTDITGYTREDAIGRSSLPGDMGLWVRAEDRERLTESLKATGEVVGLEAEFRKKDGSIIIGLMSARIIEIDGEQCILSISRDITDRKRVEEEKRQFYNETIRSVTQGKLNLVSSEDVDLYISSADLSLDVCSPEETVEARHKVVEYCISRGLISERRELFESALGEAMTNAIRHADFGRVYAGLKGSSVWVAVSDDGPGIIALTLPGATLRKGFSTKVSMGMGYSIMMEATDSIILSTSPQGTTVVLSIETTAASQAMALDDLPDTWDSISDVI